MSSYSFLLTIVHLIALFHLVHALLFLVRVKVAIPFRVECD